MWINGLKLPDALTAAIECGRLDRPAGSWLLLEGQDESLFGFGLDELRFYHTVGQIVDETAGLRYIPAPSTGLDPSEARKRHHDGGIIEAADLAHLLCIGDERDLSICLDYRRGPEQPAVIMLDELGVWRQLSPTWEGLLGMFDVEKEG